MKVVIQRVTRASVKIDSEIKSCIEAGLLVFVGIEEADNHEDIAWLSRKITQLRVMSDPDGVMNLSVIDIGAEILVISQFTLHASTIKGNRPSYIKAARPEIAEPLYQEFCKNLTVALGKPVAAGVFGAHMNIELVNDGPVTIVIDSKNKE
ncbi:MAG: D-aminoacyl-tRNA deacylase [Bacteroidota bacterium]